MSGETRPSAQERAAADRRAAEPEVRAALELMPQLVWTTTPDGYHDYYNARWYAFTGMPRPGDPAAGAEGWNWKTYLHPDDYERTLAVWGRSLATGEPYEIEYRFREAATGTYRWFLGRALPMRDAAGEIVRWFGTCTDIDDQQRTILQLATARAELEARYVETAEQAAQLRRQTEQLEEQAVELELGNQQMQEQQVELEALTASLQEANANLEAALGDALQARRQAEQARTETEAAHERTASVLESMADAYFALDADFRIVGVNAAMERRSGLPRAALLGADFWSVFPGAIGTPLETHYRRAVTERVEGHFTHDDSDGRLGLVVEVDAYPAVGGGVAVFWRDVTQRVRAEAALRASEARYRTLFDSIDEGFCVIQLLFNDAGAAVDYRFLEANPAFAQQTGLVDVAGRRVRELVPGLEAHWFEAYGRVALTGEPERFEDAAPSMGRWFDLYAFRVGAPDERKVAILFTDVSAAKAAERERDRLLGMAETLRAEAEVARARLGDVFEQAPAFIAVLRGPDHVFELANRDYYRLIGHRDVVGKPVREALPEVVKQGFIGLLDRVLATGEPFHGREVPILLARTPDAAPEERVVTFVYQALVEADGTRSGVFAHGIDVTDSVRARQAVEATAAALSASEARYRTLTEAVPVHVWTARPDGQLDFVSARTTAYFGAPAEQVLGGGWGAFVHPDDLPPAVARWAHALATGTPYQTEFRLRAGATGEYRWHLARALPERDAAGAVTGWVGTNTDVDDERRARAEADAAREAAEAANRAKSEFLAVMSHELRTPLNAIGGYAELLELGVRGAITAEQRADLERIQRSQRHLLGLINGVLNYARVDAGAVHYEIADVPLQEVLATCEAFVAPQARAKGLALAPAACEPALRVRADREKLQQIVLNLLSNAVKFTEPGGRVAIGCDELPSGAEVGPRVRVTVTDTGRGIAPDQLERVFEPFVQVDAALTRTNEGTGLGLAISRDLARAMGGELTAASTVGQGSAFALTLPSAEASS